MLNSNSPSARLRNQFSGHSSFAYWIENPVVAKIGTNCMPHPPRYTCATSYDMNNYQVLFHKPGILFP